VSRQPSRIRIAVKLGGVFAAVIGSLCMMDVPEKPPSLLPDRSVARQAIERSLEEWRTSPQSDTTAAGRTVIFVDRERQPGQKLREFAVLGDSEVDNRRRFVARLSLAEPDESILAAYYVFGNDPTWVYRAEEFDRMMNMDMDMAPPEPAASVDSSRQANPPKANLGGREERRASPR
jgi:hypothetical protein